MKQIIIQDSKVYQVEGGKNERKEHLGKDYWADHREGKLI